MCVCVCCLVDEIPVFYSMELTLAPYLVPGVVGDVAGEELGGEEDEEFPMEVRVQPPLITVVLTAITTLPHTRDFPLLSRVMAPLPWAPQEGLGTGGDQMEVEGSMVGRGTSEGRVIHL